MENKTTPTEPASEPTAAGTEVERSDRQRPSVDAATRYLFDALLNGGSLPAAGSAGNLPQARVPELARDPSFTVADALAARRAEPQSQPHTTGAGDEPEAAGAIADRERSGSHRDQGPDSTSSTQQVQWSMPAGTFNPQTSPASGTSGPQGASDDELLQLLQDSCSKMYVANDNSAAGARMFLALDEAVPGAGVELVREGAFLIVRLHARNDTAFRLMSSRRDSLHEVLDETTNLKVMVDVVRQQDASQPTGA